MCLLLFDLFIYFSFGFYVPHMDEIFVLVFLCLTYFT